MESTIVLQEGKYRIEFDGEHYTVLKGEKPLLTPGGKIAHTMFEDLARQLMLDWDRFGYESYRTAYSILSYHFSMVDNFAKFTKDGMIGIIDSCNWMNNWAFDGCPSPNPHVMMEWHDYFGYGSERIETIKAWMQNCTQMQLTAIVCIHNYYMCINVAFVMAYIVEQLKEEEHEDALRQFFDFYSNYDCETDFDEMWAVFQCFRIYYGVHFKEEGKHLPVTE